MPPAKKTATPPEPDDVEPDDEKPLTKADVLALIREVVGGEGAGDDEDLGDLNTDPDDPEGVVVLTTREIEDLIADRVNRIAKSLGLKKKNSAAPEPVKKDEPETKPIPQTMAPLLERIRMAVWGERGAK